VQESTGREKSEQGEGTESEATSKELLSDVEENEANTDSSGAELDPGPSPDGAFDASDEVKDADPM
jgi:hypothetical protein